MADRKPVVIAFDAYGTLLSTASISKQLTAYYGEEDARVIATQWRRYQLEYTWRLNSMGSYVPFSTATKAALSHAVRETGHVVTDEQSLTLMKAYDSLSIFPDVSRALQRVATSTTAGRIWPAIFSNGTRDMVHVSLSSSPDFKTAYAEHFKQVVLMDEMPEQTRRYKPAKETYEYLAGRMDRRPEEMWLITSNPFDVVGARAAGIKTAWVDRDGSGWVDGLGVALELGDPDVVVDGVDKAVDEILRREGLDGGVE